MNQQLFESVLENPGQMAHWEYQGTRSVHIDLLCRTASAAFKAPDPAKPGQSVSFELDAMEIQSCRTIGRALGYELPHLQYAATRTPLIGVRNGPIVAAALAFGALSAVVQAGVKSPEMLEAAHRSVTAVAQHVDEIPQRLEVMARSIVPRP